MATFQALQTWIGHDTTRYHTRYRTFSLSLVWFGGYLQRVTTRYRQFFQKILIYIFKINLTVTRGNPLQIATKPC